MAGLEPATLELTAPRSTFELHPISSQESGSRTHLDQFPKLASYRCSTSCSERLAGVEPAHPVWKTGHRCFWFAPTHPCQSMTAVAWKCHLLTWHGVAS